MSMTRETRRQRLERLGTLPDAQIHIKWGRVAVLALATVSLVGMGALGGIMFTMFLDTL
jgi:hypothetical protein